MRFLRVLYNAFDAGKITHYFHVSGNERFLCLYELLSVSVKLLYLTEVEKPIVCDKSCFAVRVNQKTITVPAFIFE